MNTTNAICVLAKTNIKIKKIPCGLRKKKRKTKEKKKEKKKKRKKTQNVSVRVL